MTEEVAMFLIGLLGFCAPLIGVAYVRALERLMDGPRRR
jgi:hypothetical protein